MGTGLDGVGGHMNDHFGGHFGAHIDDQARQAWAHAERVKKAMGINDDHFFPPMPPRGAGGFDGHAAGYGYSPDPRTGPSRRDPPPTRPSPHPQRDRTRPANRSDGEWARQSMPRPNEPFHYVYVGTTGPDGEIIDGYEGYRNGPPH
ncbi:hypothetical protein B0I37DRAFT_364609 [Chaetomium sp. MPI-CAGE-AT-0009]|nr:hypothetical protein B0I37DRAFT_364609 [Chaetomium sp. MPI-CAGE-AT-0009]